MKVLFVYALLIGFAAAAKIDKKKNEKKRDHHGKLIFSAKKREAKLRVKFRNQSIFDAKLRFALFSFAALSHFKKYLRGQIIGHLP